jgi:23S rRNA-/tRNA-specific pseudouridylate synthase
VGDPLYPPGGVPPKDERALPGSTGYHLHAHVVRFPHPRTSTPVVIRCGPPPLYRAGME